MIFVDVLLLATGAFNPSNSTNHQFQEQTFMKLKKKKNEKRFEENKMIFFRNTFLVNIEFRSIFIEIAAKIHSEIRNA